MENDLICRTFSASLTPGDGRTVDCRIIPYGERIEHDDGMGGVAVGVPYVEEWASGAFKHQERAANRVLANVEHQTGIAGVVGHGLALREEPDALYGSFKIHETPAGDTALLLVKEGVLDTVSLEARPVKTFRTRAGVIRRVKANLEAVAFTRFSAYSGAQVLAVRERAERAEIVEEQFDEELLPVEMDPELVERCRSLGLQLPDRYTTHPSPEPPSSGEDTGSQVAPVEQPTT